MSEAPWSCITDARRRLQPRVPFLLGDRLVGSVAEVHLDALASAATDDAPHLRVEARAGGAQVRWLEPAQATAGLAGLNARLRERGLVVGWRDEPYAVVDPALPPALQRPLAVIERAAARFWGTLTFGAHANGYLADAAGRPTHLWIARRALTKATDPGKLDNLVGGGVPHGQTPFETMVREGWEEAGLAAPQVHTARAGRVLQLDRDVPEGLQFERLHVFDIELPQGETPSNQDGEVAGFRCMPVAEALAHARAGDMTVDAALVTLDFALRHRLLPADEHAGAARTSEGLWVEPDGIQPV